MEMVEVGLKSPRNSILIEVDRSDEEGEEKGNEGIIWDSPADGILFYPASCASFPIASDASSEIDP
jgi:hypothetical protein